MLKQRTSGIIGLYKLSYSVKILVIIIIIIIHVSPSFKGDSFVHLVFVFFQKILRKFIIQMGSIPRGANYFLQELTALKRGVKLS